MRKLILVISAVGLLVASFEVLAHEAMDLPPGPIKDRHELMEGIGKNAKAIGDALKANDTKPIPAAAEAIAASARKIPALFPPGSTNAKSRAKPEIWKDFDKFESLSADLATKADAVAKAVSDYGAVGDAAKAMFSDCKSCHDAFREPEEDEKK